MNVDQIIEGIVGREGGFTDNPKDKGGPTRWGITQAVARQYGYTGDMRTLPREVAKAIYLELYYVGPKFDQVHALSPRIAEELTDTGVNCGQAVAAKFLQRALNAFNREARIYPDIIVDGQLGIRSLAALRAYLEHRGVEGEEVMLKALNCLQGERYIDLAEGRQANEEFCYGWIRARVELP